MIACGCPHIADALNAAMRFVEGGYRSDLDSDEMRLFALVRAVEIVGEAAAGLRPRHIHIATERRQCAPISRSMIR